MKGYIYRMYIDNLNYYGKTTRNLKIRYLAHKYGYESYKKKKCRFCTAYKLFELGIPKIEIVKEIEINNKYDIKLKQLEKEFIINNVCINKVIPLRTHNEYVKDNKNKVDEYQKNFMVNYRIENKEKLKKYGKEKVICPCCLKYMNKSTFKYQHFKICYNI
jgi:hypothetical protein